MDEPKRPEAEESPYLKLPWPLVAGGLAAVLLVALAAGLLANRFVRQPTVVLPPPTAVSIAAATPGTPAIVAAPTAVGPAVTVGQQPTSTVPASALVATATPPRSTPQPATATPVPSGASATAPGTGVATVQPTISTALVDEVNQAYERYWQIRAEALFDLDEARLSEVMAGEHLDAVAQFIRELRAENRAVETAVTHSYVFTEISPREAALIDTYVDNSVYVEPQTGVRVSQPIGNTLKEFYRLSKANGEWRVVSAIRSP